MKKRISLFLIPLILISLLLLSACFEDDGAHEGGTSQNPTNDSVSGGTDSEDESYSTELLFELNPDGESYSVVRSKTTGYSGDIVIPKKYNDLPVTEIGDNAFTDCENLLSVRIPEGIVKIGKSAFSYCRELTEISLPESLRSIGDSAFFACKKLSRINFSEGLTEIGSFAFRQCSALTEVVMPESVTTIGCALFNECYSLERCVLSQGITEIPEVETGAYGLFFDCGSLRSVTLPENISCIPAFTFAGCGSLKEIKIPDSVRELRSHAISMCHSLTSLTIPEGVTKIDPNAIEFCGSLFEVVNKSSVKLKPLGSSESGVEVFAKSVITNEAASRIETVDDFVFYIGENEIYLLKYIGDEKAVTLPILDGGKKYTVYSGVFTGVDNVQSLTLPNSIKFISNDAFEHLDCLETLILDCADAEIESEYFGPNETVKTVYLNVSNNFELGYFYKLEKVVCGEGLTAIPDRLFEGSSIQSIEISSTVESIGEYAFNQSRLTEIVFKENSSLKSIGKGAFRHTHVKEITIPEGIVELSEECFSYSGVMTINLPNSLKRIGKNAFMGCSMRSINLPDSLVEIGEGAFSHCISLMTVSIGEGSSLESIGYRAFYDCQILSTFTIPKNVSHIGGGVIAGSGVRVINLSSENTTFEIVDNVLYSEDKTELVLCSPKRTVDVLTLPKTLKKVAPYALYSCMNIKRIVFENCAELESIGEYAFWGCGIESAKLPASVSSIGKYAFGYCQMLKEVDISLCSVSELSDGIFADCYQISSIDIPKNIKRIGENAFYYTGITTVNYGGSMAEWEALEKGYGWDTSMGDYLDRYSIVCIDGTISKE